MTSQNPAADRISRPWAAIALVGLLLAVGAALSFFPYREPPPTAEFTLVGSDRQDVACLGGETVAGFSCGFGLDGVELSLDEAKRLQPFLTLDRHTYLVAGMFRVPVVEKQYDRESPATPREQRKRFTVRCAIHEVGRFSAFKVHWLQGSPWSDPQAAPVITVSDCEIRD